MQVIYKEHLDPGLNKIDLPVGAEILSVAAQNDAVKFWYIFEVGERRTKTRRLHVKTTGSHFNEREAVYYLGTVLLYGGTVVAHVFEEL